MPRGVPSGAAGGTSCTPSSPTRSPPATGWLASLHGPWLVPEHDTLDGRAFYAAKSAERERAPLLLRLDRHAARATDDDGAWQWAGTMSVLEAEQRPDGTLAFGLTDELLGSFTQVLPLDRTVLARHARCPRRAPFRHPA